MKKVMVYKQKLDQILGVTGWPQSRLAKFLGVDDRTLRQWLKGQPIKQATKAVRIDWFYEDVVKPSLHEIEERANAAEKKMLGDDLSQHIG